MGRRYCFSNRRMPRQGNDALGDASAMSALAPISRHLQCTSPCLLWAKSGHSDELTGDEPLLDQLAFQHKTTFRGSCSNQMKRASSFEPLQFSCPPHNLPHPLVHQLWLAVGSSDEHGLNGPFDVGFVSVRFGEL